VWEGCEGGERVVGRAAQARHRTVKSRSMYIYIYVGIYVYMYICICIYRERVWGGARRAALGLTRGWPLHDIASANIMWYILQ